jgi:hypothetical protein
MMTYCSKYILFRPRNGRRKFRNPVQIPSIVLQCTSRTPSPSSSRANSPRLWSTVACPRPLRASGLYPFQSSVYTIAPGSVAGRTVASTSSADPLRWPTLSQSRPLSRPVTPGTGGRSVSQVPWPLAWLARRRGGSSGSVCGTPFFPRVLVQLVGLGVVVRQRHAVGVGQRASLDGMPQSEQMLAADPQLAGELRGGHPLGDAAEDQEDLSGGQMGPLPGGISEHVEDPTAALTSMIDDRGVGTAAVDVEAVAGATAGTGEAIRVEQLEEFLSATLLVHEIDDREVHGVGSEEMRCSRPEGQENRSAQG